MESRQHKLRSVRSVSAALALAGALGRWSAPKARPTLFSRALAKWALQIALVVFVPGGSIVLALLWWFDQRGNA
jgi:hypothetical protein